MDLTKSPAKLVRTNGADLMAKVPYVYLPDYGYLRYNPESNFSFFLRLYRESMHFKADFEKPY